MAASGADSSPPPTSRTPDGGKLLYHVDCDFVRWDPLE